MTWTSLAIAAFSVAVFYLLTWLYALNERVRTCERAMESIPVLRFNLSGVEARLASIENTTKTDPLTGMGSAILLESDRWFAALRSATPLCVAWFDLNNMKELNDREGHAAGDEAIRALAAALRSATRRGYDEVFRLHTKGDEFVVLMHGQLNPISVAKEIRKHIHAHGVRVSGGIAYTNDKTREARQALRLLAEEGCKRSKIRNSEFALSVWVSGSWFDVDSEDLDTRRP